MAYGGISDAIVSSWLSSLRNSAVFASVHYDVPSWIDPGASEVFSAGYSRQPVTWAVESARGITVSLPLLFPSLPSMTVAAVGLWTSLVGGTMVAYCTAAPGDTAYLSATGTWTLPANELAIRL